MVKGVSRQVIVVRQPDRRLFEQAIFLVKEEALSQPGVTAQQVLSEARRVAQGYVRRGRERQSPRWLTALLGALGGAAGTGLIWAVLTLV